MKRLLKLLLMLLPLLLLVTCGEDDTREVTLTPDTSSITADGQDKVTFTVKYGEEVVTSNVKITANGEAITGMTFSTTTPGEYKFTAEYEGKTSEEKTVTAVMPEALVLSVDKSTITGNGVDEATFTVKLGDRDVTGSSEIIQVDKNAVIAGNKFTGMQAGEYEFYAVREGAESNKVTVKVEAAPAGSLVLSVDKSTISADGEDKATFTVTRDGTDITADCNVCLPDGVYLPGPVYTADEPGEYEFYASLKSDATIKSNNVKVTAVSEDTLVLSVDKSSITADGADEARFTVTKGGTDVTADCNVCMKDGACLINPVFTTAEAGEYEFYAALKSDETIKSNYVKVTATAEDVLQLSANKTAIKGDGVEEAVFTVKLNDQDVTSGAEIFKDGVKIESDKFKTYEAGEYEFTAKYQGKESNTLKVTVEKVDLVLSADKGTMKADGTDAVTFTAKMGDVNVTSGVTIKYGGITLNSNIFTTSESGEYEFTATLKANESIVSNTVRIVAETEIVDELVLLVDNANLIADGQQKATFTITFNGTHVTALARLFKNGIEYDSREFLGTLPGDYVFQANYEYDGKFIESNTVTVTVVAMQSDFDATKTLHKNVSFFTMTATWCGPCSYFKGYIKNVMSDYPDNVLQVNLYSGDSDAMVKSSLTSSFISQLKNQGGFRFDGYPSSVVDLYEEIGTPGYVPSEPQVRAAYAKYIQYPARTGIHVNSSAGTETIDVTVTVGAKEADTYYLGILLVEDNIVAYQNGGGNNYNHMDVFRAKGMTNAFGDELATLTAGQTISRNFSFTMDAKYNVENLSVLVYVVYELDGKKIIGNAVKAPVNGVTDFKYTN